MSLPQMSPPLFPLICQVGRQTTAATTTTTGEKNKPPQCAKERYKSLSLNIIFLVTTIFTAALIRHVSAADAQVMAQLAQSIKPTPTGRDDSPNFCKWSGVNCDSSNRVTSINLESKSLSGTLPSELNQLSGLRSLSLQRNQFSGPLPVLSNLGALEDVTLDENSFDSIPTGFLSGLTSLQSFSISNNTNLPPWNIPETLQDSSSLTTFYASKANIVGEIPDIFGSMPNLQSLRLSYNNLTGSLPASFAKSGIQNLWLNNQVTGLSGPIDILGTMTELQVAWLQSNKYSGPIPDLSACTELTDLQLRDNALTGVIPDSLTKLPKLKTVALQNNKFQGPIPSFPGGIQANLGTTNNFCLSSPGPCDPQVTALLDVAGAMYYPSALADSWEGNDPCQQWNFITCEEGSVAIVNFGRQNWTGTISPSYANLTNLKSLFLNDNKLVGTIPQSLTSLKNLQTLDLSNNNISGQIPSFASSVTVRVSGNVFIGRDVAITYPPGRSPASNNNGASGAGTDGGSKRSISPWTIVFPIIIFVIVIAILGFVIYRRNLNKQNKYAWVSEKSRRKSEKQMVIENIDQGKDNVKSPNSTSITTETPISISDYHIYDGGNITIPIEVLREATDNFNENNILGRGGFGIVYKGQLHDGTKIAVKRMESSMLSDKGLHEFKAEIEVLTKVRHRHLVALHGFCDNGNERLLVYEYMPQGCLGQHLFHWKDMGVPPLNWNQRVIIALDVARGVEYLHSLAQQSFIHRDLKPSNILLGDDIRAKVSDFGLVRSAPDGNYSVETKLAGTFGYLAPEYAGEKCHLVTWFRSSHLQKKLSERLSTRSSSSHSSTKRPSEYLEGGRVAATARPERILSTARHEPCQASLSPLVEHWKPSLAMTKKTIALGLISI
ncbi:hypothetical protein DH2020_021955 [Rehmannia glutinosa]|uniref:Protein kinase domain-containing protein n=1 Tax=Rehmannia glutinosa TaxID=99300 RepID=A0ABR0WG41_REHGL